MSRLRLYVITISLFCLVSIMVLPTFAQGLVILWPVPDDAVMGECDTSIGDYSAGVLLICEFSLDDEIFHLSAVVTPDGMVVFTSDFVDELKTELVSDPILNNDQKQSVMGKLEQAQHRLDEGRYGLAGLSLHTATDQYFQIVNNAQGDPLPCFNVADTVAGVLMAAGAITPSDLAGAITPSDLVGNQTPLDHVGVITRSD